MKDYKIDTDTTSILEPAVQDHKVEKPQMEKISKRPVTDRIAKALGIILVCVALSALTFYLAQSSNKGGDARAGRKDGKDRPVPIEVATAYSGTVPIEIHTIGNVLPYSVVNVVPQVGGQLTQVYFKQGDFVKKGDLLFQIDPRPYQAALDQALGTLQKDKAMLQQAQANLAKDTAQISAVKANLHRDAVQSTYAATEMNRYTDLANQGAVSNEQRDQMRTNALAAAAVVQASKSQVDNAEAVVQADRAAIETAKGTIAADQAAVENARIQLGFTQIRSPIDGRTSSLNVYQGNVVSANSSTPLVTIDQVQPIYVNFTVPEEYLDELRQSKADGSLKVTVRVEGARKESFVGNVSFLEHTINTTTGTLMMRAELANQNNRLYSGQYVDVIVDMPAQGESVCLPSQAVQNTQNGQSVYVVDANNTVELRQINVLRTRRGVAAVNQGVKSGDVVVTDGIMQLKPGAKVQIVSQYKAPILTGPGNIGIGPDGDSGGSNDGAGAMAPLTGGDASSGDGSGAGAGSSANPGDRGNHAPGRPAKSGSSATTGSAGSNGSTGNGLSTNFIPGIGGPGTGGGDSMNPADPSRGSYGPVAGDDNSSFGQAAGGVGHRPTGSESPGALNDVRRTGTGSPGSRIDDVNGPGRINVRVRHPRGAGR